MSKKISISFNNIRNELSSLFHKSLSSMGRCHRGGGIHNMDEKTILWLAAQGYFDDNGLGDEDIMNYYYGDDDDCDVIWPPKSKSCSIGKKGKKSRDVYAEYWEEEEKNGRKKKHKHSKRSGKARIININEPYSGEEECPMEYGGVDDDGIYDGKLIYYYPDYHNKDNRLEFETLYAFNEFCNENGYKVPDHVANDIMYRRVSHTCLMPDAREYGLYEIMAEESYGSMFYEACDGSEVETMA